MKGNHGEEERQSITKKQTDRFDYVSHVVSSVPNGIACIYKMIIPFLSIR